MSQHRVRSTTRVRQWVTGLGLAVVSMAALLMSFTSLHALAVLCGYSDRMAMLLPVLLDAGAGVATYTWLATDAAERARQFARKLAIGLLSTSVALNALGHGLASAGVRPHWLVVVAVSGLAPAILGACVHLVGLQNQPGEPGVATPGEAPGEAGDQPGANLAATPGDQQEPGAATPGETITATLADQPGEDHHQVATHPGGLHLVSLADQPGEAGGDTALETRARDLVAAGAGRGRLAKELDLTESQARALLAKVKPAVNGKAAP